MINTELFKEVSPLSAKDCFILIERQKSNFNFPIHIHPEYELNYIENAKGAQRIVGDSIEEIEEEEYIYDEDYYYEENRLEELENGK